MDARDHLVEKNAQRPEIPSRIGGSAAQPLRRKIGAGALGGARQGGGAEADDPHPVLGIHQDLGGVEGAVDDPLGVGARQAGGDLGAYVDRLLQTEGAAGEPDRERLAFIQGHGQEDTAVAGLPDLVDVADVRVADRRGPRRLFGEALPRGLVVRAAAARQELQGDHALLLEILRLVERRPLILAAEALDDPVVRNHAADQTVRSREWC